MFIGNIHAPDTTTSTFPSLVESGALYVDKTRFIEHFLTEPSKVQILCRQRRLGKSLNLDTLYRFLTKHKDYRHLFEGLYIQKSPLWRLAHTKPVFLLDFKNMTPADYQKTIKTSVMNALSLYLEDNPCPKSIAGSYEAWKANQTDGSESLKLLIDIVADLDEKPIILIDEYDKLIMDQVGNKEKYIEIRDYLTYLFSAAFKGNDNLEKALMIGVTRVSHEGMLSGLNNPITFDVFMDATYTEDFGFTEEEMLELQRAAGFELSDAKRWYNGICVGGRTIYNTFGVMSMMKTRTFDCYWGNTGNLKTIRTMLTGERKRILTSLLEPDVHLSVEIDKRISPEQLDVDAPDSYFYSFLVQTGYLALHTQRIGEDGEIEGEVSIPNFELRVVWRRFILDFFIVGEMKPPVDLFNTNDAGKLAKGLQTYLSDVFDALSYHDLPYRRCSDGKYRVPEELYQHLLFGLFFSLSSSLGFRRVKSNRESGDGRYDISLEAPEEVFILELKPAAEDEDLDARAQLALDQIKKKRYAAEYPGKPVTGIGLGLRKKSCAAAAEALG